MSKVSSNPPSGFRDFPPAEAAARLELVETITRIYRSHGFQAIGMPLLENLSTLQGKGGGGDNEKLIFKVLKRGEDLQRSIAASAELADMGLRFDLTLPLARYCARFREQLPKPFKVFQIGPVWRADRPQKGRYREFYQCDVDIVGAREIGAEVDCLSAILEVFSALGMEGIELHLNDRRLLSALGTKIGASESTWGKCLVTLDKLDKIGEDKVREEMLAQLQAEGIDPAHAVSVLDHFFPKGGAALTPAWSEMHREAVGGLEDIKRLLAPGTRAEIVLNPTLVRGQDYYTGTIFEIRHSQLAGSLGGGGRYNRLLEVFGSPETPAFGGSIGFERLFLLLEEQKSLASLGAAPQIFFPLLEEGLRAEVSALARGLRAQGIAVDVYPDAAKLKSQFKYADDRKIPFTAILGSEELAQKKIKLKDMAKGTETTYSLASPENFFKEMFSLCNRH